MGLDTSHDCWHGPYSSFGRWRTRLAVLAGYGAEIDPTDGIEGPKLDWPSFAHKNYQGEWDETPSDPLLILLVHSDCDGQIQAQHAGPLAARLEELLPKMTARDDLDYTREKTSRFISGLRRAAAANEPVVFK